MATWDELFLSNPPPGPNAAKGAPATPDRETHIASGIVGDVKDVAVDAAKGLNRGFWSFVGNVTEAMKAQSAGEALPTSAGRIFFGSDLVDSLGISAYSRSKLAAREASESKGVVPYSLTTPEQRQRLRLAGVKVEEPPVNSSEGIRQRFSTSTHDDPASGVVGKIVGGGTEVLGNPANLVGGPMSAGTKALPMLAQLSRPGVTAFGAGVGAELGSMAGGPAAVAVTGDEGSRGTGEIVGSVTGAVLGGNANDIRLNALKTVASPISNLGKAVAGTAKAVRAGDERRWLTIFADNYRDLNAEAKGILTESVRARYADAIANDISAQKSLDEFHGAITASGGPSNAPWNLAQKTTTPVLVEESRFRVPATKEESLLTASATSQVQQDVLKRYTGLVDKAEVGTAKDIANGLEELRKETNLKLDSLATQGQQVAGTVHHFDLPGTSTSAAKGAELRTLAEAEVAKTAEVARQKYATALAMDDQLGAQIQPEAIRKAGGGVLDQLLTQIDRSTAPESIRRLVGVLRPSDAIADQIRELQKGLATADPVGRLKINNQVSDLRKQAAAADTKPLALRDLNDISIALNNDARTVAASASPGSAVAARNIGQVREALEETIKTNLPPVVRQAYDEARDYYRTVQVPRAREGATANIRRTAGSARPGEERVVDEKVLDEFLKPAELETRMGQFDKLFGGMLPGTARNEQAYRLLGEGLENEYYKNLLTRQDLTPEKHIEFMRKWNAALERAPETRAKLNDTFTDLMGLEAQKAEQVQKWRDISNHPLTQTLGVDGAKATMSRALSDPNRMNQLVNYTIETKGREALQPLVRYVMELADPRVGGTYDGRALATLLHSGAAGPDRVSAIQTLFRRAYGDKVGDQHFANLNGIATLAQRELETRPEFLRPRDMASGPIVEATGQSGASWLNQVNAVRAGRTSILWTAATAGGRFANAKLNEAIRKLQFDALYDPQASAAVLAMAQTDARRPLSGAAWDQVKKRLGEDGKGITRKLIDAGAILPITAQSGRIGFTERAKEVANED